MPAGEGRGPGPKTVPVSCRLPFEKAQRIFEQAEAAGLSLSDYLRDLLVDAAAAVERAVEAARQAADHAVQVEQELRAVRAELAVVRATCADLQRQALKREEQIGFAGAELLTSVECLKRLGWRYRPDVLYWVGRLPRDDPHRILPRIATQLVEVLNDISDQRSTSRVDLNRDRTRLRRAEWLVRILSTEVGCSADGEAQPMADWLPAEAALDAAKRALEKRCELAGDS
jgi:hypothetical protein